MVIAEFFFFFFFGRGREDTEMPLNKSCGCETIHTVNKVSQGLASYLKLISVPLKEEMGRSPPAHYGFLTSTSVSWEVLLMVEIYECLWLLNLPGCTSSFLLMK